MRQGRLHFGEKFLGAGRGDAYGDDEAEGDLEILAGKKARHRHES